MEFQLPSSASGPTGSSARSRLYLDIDGVIRAERPPWGDAKTVTVRTSLGIDQVTYSPHLVHAIDALWYRYAVELVIVSSWLEDDAIDGLTDMLGAFEYARRLPVPPRVGVGAELPDYWKRDAILRDLQSAPSPFMWVDDDEPQRDGIHIAAAVDQPVLLLTPNPFRGLTSADLTSIERFAADQHSHRQAA